MSTPCTQDCTAVFKRAKNLLLTTPVLLHYDPKLPLILAGDTCAYDVGEVLSHMFPDGSERPIAYASHTLNSSEHNYS